MSVETNLGVTDTITCPLSNVLYDSCLVSLSLGLDGTNMCGLDVINGIMATRLPRSSGSHGTIELRWQYTAGLQVLLQSVLVSLVLTSC